MDEPLSNLMPNSEPKLRAQIVKLQRQLGTTTIYVTHDQTEAMTMGDRIAVMNHGHSAGCSPIELQPPSYLLCRGIHWLTADEFLPVSAVLMPS